jgi:hypothetical protein
MTCDRGFLHSFGVWGALSVCPGGPFGLTGLQGKWDGAGYAADYQRVKQIIKRGLSTTARSDSTQSRSIS